MRLSEIERDQIAAASRPLLPERRALFAQAVEVALAGCPEVGAGVLHRTICEVQRHFFDPPDTARGKGAPIFHRRRFR